MERNQIPYFSETVAYSVPTSLSLDNGDTITSPYDTPNIFNTYFANIAETTKKSLKYSHKLFSDYLSSKSDSAIFQNLLIKKK